MNNIDFDRLRELRKECEELEAHGLRETQKYDDLFQEYCQVLGSSPVTQEDIEWATGVKNAAGKPTD